MNYSKVEIEEMANAMPFTDYRNLRNTMVLDVRYNEHRKVGLFLGVFQGENVYVGEVRDPVQIVALAERKSHELIKEEKVVLFAAETRDEKPSQLTMYLRAVCGYRNPAKYKDVIREKRPFPFCHTTEKVLIAPPVSYIDEEILAKTWEAWLNFATLENKEYELIIYKNTAYGGGKMLVRGKPDCIFDYRPDDLKTTQDYLNRGIGKIVAYDATTGKLVSSCFI